MGNCCSSNSVAPKDPEDKTLDEVEILRTRVAQFDDVFNGAADPLNTAVTLNNGIITAVEKIKEAAAAIFGANVIKVEVTDRVVAVTVCEVDDEGKEIELSADKLQALFQGPNGANFQTAWNAAVRARETLNAALAEAPQVSIDIKKARLFYTVGESKAEDEDRISAARGQIMGFNNSVFKAKLELTRACAEQALDPKAAIKEIFANLKKHINNFVPRVDLDLSGISDGHIRFEIVMPRFDTKILPHKIRVAYLALFSENSDDMGLIPTVKEVVGALSGLTEQLQAAQEAVQGLPTDPNELTQAAQNAGLPITWLPKVPTRMANNAKAIASAPQIMAQLQDTIRGVCTEVKEAVEELP